MKLSHRTMTRILLSFLSIGLLLAPVYAQEPTPKKEIINGNLNENGDVERVDVLNTFKKEGTIIDYGDYETIKNLTGSDAMKQSNDLITINNSDIDFQYEGSLNDTNLPWEFDITVLLDQEEIEFKELAGLTGRLDMHIDIKENKTINASFYEDYSLQIILMFNDQTTRNLTVSQGTDTKLGDKIIVTSTYLPNQDINYHIQADVIDFEMEPIIFNGTFLNLNLDIQNENLKETTNDLLQQSSAINLNANQLEQGSNQIIESSSNLESTAAMLQEGTNDLDQGIDAFIHGLEGLEEGLKTLNENSKSLTNGSKEFKNALKSIEENLDQVDTDSFNDFNIDDLKELKEGNQLAQKTIQELNQNLKQLFTFIEEEYDNLNEEQQELIQQLLDNLDLPEDIDWEAINGDLITEQLDQVLELFNGNIQVIDALIKLEPLLNLTQDLSEGMRELIDAYETLDDGIHEYTDGVARMVVGYEQIITGSQSLSVGSKLLRLGTNSLQTNTKILSKDIENFHAGSQSLSDKMEILNDTTQQVDDKTFNKIHEIISLFDKNDPVIQSFVDERNENIESVEFVIKTKEINKQGLQDDTEPKEDLSFWQKILNFFKRK